MTYSIFSTSVNVIPGILLASTAYHANELGFRTILIDDCSRGIRAETIQETFERVKADYGCVVNSTEVWSGRVTIDTEWLCACQVKAMVQGRDRRPELGYKLAVECRRNIVYPVKNKNSKYNNMTTTSEPDKTNQGNVNESNHNSAKVSSCNSTAV